MEIDRSGVKAHAKQLIKDSDPKVLTASLIVMVLGALIALLSGRLVGITWQEAARYLQYIQDGNTEAAITIIVEHTPSAGAQLVNLLLEALLIIVSLGFEIFLLNTLRGTTPELGNLLDGFSYWWKLLVMDFVIGLFVFLWSLLLIVPGIVAAYRYSMANYVLITHPDFGIMECIRESKRLTKGWKGTLFVLDLSFFGWMLLSMVPVVGWLISVWVTPYRGLTFLEYYEQISGYTAPAQNDGEPWAV